MQRSEEDNNTSSMSASTAADVSTSAIIDDKDTSMMEEENGSHRKRNRRTRHDDGALDDILGQITSKLTSLSTQETREGSMTAFLEVLQCTQSEAAFYLESAAWNIETAVILYLENNPPSTTTVGYTSHMNPLFNERLSNRIGSSYLSLAEMSTSCQSDVSPMGRKRGFHKRSISGGDDGQYTNMYTSPRAKWRERNVEIADLPAEWTAKVSAHTGQILFTHIPTGLVQNFVPNGFADNEHTNELSLQNDTVMAEEINEYTEGMFPLAKAEISMTEERNLQSAAMEDDDIPLPDNNQNIKPKSAHNDAFPGGVFDDRGISPPSLHDNTQFLNQQQNSVFHSAAFDGSMQSDDMKLKVRDNISTADVRIMNPLVSTNNPNGLNTNDSECGSSMNNGVFSDATAGSGDQSSNNTYTDSSSNGAMLGQDLPFSRSGAASNVGTATLSGNKSQSFQFGSTDTNHVSTFSSAVSSSNDEGIFGNMNGNIKSGVKSQKQSLHTSSCDQSGHENSQQNTEGFMTQDSLIMGSSQSTPHNSQSH